ncbi:Spy/CpxP family protein refolding chaperone [Hoeflea poritis]|uniref:Spy/CpxP family protein refolding chaperone n=1 Tax=Hoeflea poritis TaxID=2993659 RepID=A0ABT4VJQ2_9HYPH|nr:Spy/CpxP family protein refolding chaperone [Hoeflea poritis]MDA4844901.1 Spy/CpxP family protein refolding chaperone [Hoeflea poritis]
MTQKPPVNTVRLIFLGGFYLFLLLLYATAAPAQENAASGRPAAAEQIRAMADQLNLSDQQRQALIPILQQHGQATKAILEKHGIDPASGERPPLRKMLSVRGDMKKNRAAFEKQVAAILSPAQMDTFKRLQEQQRQALRARLTGAD